ncbi:MAG: hypothetical protein WBB22_15545, partial [Anaerolineae bacterium]
EEKTPDYIASAPGGEPAGELGKVIRAVEAAGGDPTNLVEDLEDTYVAGKYHPYKVFSHALALLALDEVGESVQPNAVTTLEDAQREDGGWSWAWGGSTSDVDSTGRSLQALAAGGGPISSTVSADAASFLQELQFTQGGFPDLATRTEANCNSTALAIEGLLAAGRYRDEPLLFSTGGGRVGSAWDALLAFQEQGSPDAGSFAFTASQPEIRLLATLDAIPSLVSPFYPAYEPLSEGAATSVGAVSPRLTCGGALQVVAPHTGDDDNDGSASLRYRVVGSPSWSGPIVMDKSGLAYLELLDLSFGTEYEIEVTYGDPDGISGDNPQSFTIHLGKSCIPLAISSYGG